MVALRPSRQGPISLPPQRLHRTRARSARTCSLIDRRAAGLWGHRPPRGEGSRAAPACGRSGGCACSGASRTAAGSEGRPHRSGSGLRASPASRQAGTGRPPALLRSPRREWVVVSVGEDKRHEVQHSAQQHAAVQRPSLGHAWRSYGKDRASTGSRGSASDSPGPERAGLRYRPTAPSRSSRMRSA